MKEGVVLKPFERVYVGKEARKKITYIIGRIGYDELTTTAKMELAAAVEKIVLNRESWFINFFNTAQAITPRMHALELIPGIGKKYMWQILDEKDFGGTRRRKQTPTFHAGTLVREQWTSFRGRGVSSVSTGFFQRSV